MTKSVKLILILNLVAITVLTFAFAHLMISPGKLVDGHRASETDCFACHDMFFGASSKKCVTCHKVSDIGVLTSKGTPLLTKKTKIPFHQKLLEEDCVACHSDHLGVAKYRIRQRFFHGLVDASSREECVACHQRPTDDLHRQVSDKCVQCHVIEKWKPAKFKHDMLASPKLENCLACHKAKLPTDALHRGVSEKCGQCHTTEKWKPATFDHAKFFVLDDYHRRCTTCHRTPDYKKYTCYSCHEHLPEKVREEHLEEGIRDFENCVACHRSTDEDEAKKAWDSLRRGVPYQFGIPFEKKDMKRKKKHDDDDD